MHYQNGGMTSHSCSLNPPILSSQWSQTRMKKQVCICEHCEVIEMKLQIAKKALADIAESDDHGSWKTACEALAKICKIDSSPDQNEY